MGKGVENEDRNSRNIGLFGADGQDRLAQTTVTIAGLGGLGSHVAQQLAYLGVRHFVLCDPDRVSVSNLNRLVGATPRDAAAAIPKVAIAESLILAIQPEADVRSRFSSFEEASDNVFESAFIFGCVDKDLARLRLMEMCADARRPYFDIATDTGGDERDPWYGGRLVACQGRGCLVCLDALNQEAIRLERATPEELEVHARTYGVPASVLARTGPSVVSINGVVASLAVTEFMVEVTGLRQAAIELTYRADMGIVKRRRDPGPPECFYCARMNAAQN